MNRPSKTPKSPNSCQAPSLNLLDPCPPLPADDEADNRSVADNIRQFFSTFDLRASVGKIEQGPIITRYQILNPGATTKSIIDRVDDLGLWLKRKVRAVETDMSEPSIHFEIPRPQNRRIALREVLDSEAWKSQQGRLPLGLGLSVLGAPVFADLRELRHILIGGTSAESRADVIHSIILSLLFRLGPDQFKLILIDSSSSGLGRYHGLPHLDGQLGAVICGPEQGLTALRSMRNADLHGRAAPLVVVISDLAELLALADKEVGDIIFELARDGENPNLHFIVGTSRPDIPGIVKAVMASRIALSMARIGSLKILYKRGAETLVEPDMLLLTPKAETIRIHPPSPTSAEIERVTRHFRRQGMTPIRMKDTDYHALLFWAVIPLALGLWGELRPHPRYDPSARYQIVQRRFFVIPVSRENRGGRDLNLEDKRIGRILLTLGSVLSVAAIAETIKRRRGQ